MKKRLFYSIILLLILIRPQSIIAKTYNWKGISYAEYVNNLNECQLLIYKYKWSNSIWPKANKIDKPKFEEVVDYKSIKQKVLLSLKMQSALSDYFNVSINERMIQQDINRMVRNTKDSIGLKYLFDLFEKDSNTIYQCISRPQIVKRIFLNKYNRDKNIHKLAKDKAQIELNEYLRSSRIKTMDTDINNYTYKVKEATSAIENLANSNGERVIELTKKQFIQKREEYSKSTLIENKYGYVFNEILKQNDKILEIKSFTWRKKNFNEWLNDIEDSQFKKIQPTSLKLKIPEINTNKNRINKNVFSASQGFWDIPDIPSHRTGHTAIWTGSEMIVWGGFNGEHLNSGSRYDPITDNWLAMNINGAPLGKSGHTAIWTGTEMIVWGGGSGVQLISNTGGRYNPITDSWLSTTTINSPARRFGHTAIWTGEEMLIWGGNLFSRTNTGALYNPTTNSWANTNVIGAPTKRDAHTAVWTGTEMIVWGGNDETLQKTNTGGRYNPLLDSWSLISSDHSRENHTAVWTGTEMIVWGGSDDNDFYSQTGESYNPSTNSWFNLNLQGAPSGRKQHSAIWTGLNMIIWGGNNNGININTGAQYNPDTDSWTEVTTTGISVKGRVSTVWTGDEMIIWGGETSGEGGKYDPITNSWTLIQNRGKVPEARFEHSAVWTGNEMVVWGGESQYGGDLNTGAKYDPITDNWEPTSLINAPSKRKYQSNIWTGTEMIVWGGQTVSGTYLNTGARYNPIDDSWVATSVNPQEFGKFNHAAVWTGTEMIIWGGNFNDTNEGTKYNPSTDSWIDMNTANAPEGRRNHTAIWTGSEMVIWGGNKEFSPFYLNTGGVYNSNTNSWSSISTENSPTARYKHTAIWTGHEMIVWGGFVGGNGFNTGAIYNPSNDSWSSMNTPDAPSGRSSHTAVWNGHEMMIWGGVTNAFFDSNTGGRFNPTFNSWTTISNLYAPVGRGTHTSVWTGKNMIVWGGELINSFNNTNTMGIYYINYFVGGMLNGLVGNQLTIAINGREQLTLVDNGEYFFNQLLLNGDSYNITLVSNPVLPRQTCEIANGMGQISGNDILNVAISCTTNTYSVEGNITGLIDGNQLVIQNNLSEELTLFNNEHFKFLTLLEDQQNYEVTIKSPAVNPIQPCIINNQSGIIDGENIIDVSVNCDIGTDLFFRNGFE